MTDNSWVPRVGGLGALEALHAETVKESLDRLRREVAELRASRERLVLGFDADRRALERELHDRVQQRLVALAVGLQQASLLVDGDPAAARARLDELGRDVRQALDEAAQLAGRIHPPLLDAGGLAAALRSAAAFTGVRASVTVTAAATYPSELVLTVYLCCLEALAGVGAGATARVTVGDDGGAIAFDVVGDRAPAPEPAGPNDRLDRLRDRVEALGGRLTTSTKPGAGSRVSGSLPLAR